VDLRIVLRDAGRTEVEYPNSQSARLKIKNPNDTQMRNWRVLVASRKAVVPRGRALQRPDLLLR